MPNMENTLLTGVVQSGGPANPQPISGATVRLFEATADQPVMVGSSTTDTQGEFDIELTRDTSESIFYVTAKVGQSVELVTIIGPIIDNASIRINELTTVAAAFSMAQFVKNGTIGGDAFGLRIASLMNENLVSVQTGDSSQVLLNPPNADETNSLRSTRSLANLLVKCVQEVPGASATLFMLTTPPSGTTPATTFQALVNIARYPNNNLAPLYAQSQQVNTYSPALQSEPQAWTLAVKVNDTGSPELLFAGPANIAFDDRGYAWIPNNVIQGTPVSGAFAVVLKPNGKPADGSPTAPWENPEGHPKSPLLKGGLFGGGFGVAISRGEDTNGCVWFGNFGWGTAHYWPCAGSLSLFSPAGVPLSPDPAGIVGATLRVQGVALDQSNNLWTASFGNGRVVVFLSGGVQHYLYASTPTGYFPFDVAVAADGSAWVTSSTGLYEYTEGNLSRYRLFQLSQHVSVLGLDFSRPLGRGVKGLSIDSLGNIWVASGGDDAVCLLDQHGRLISEFKGGIHGPWGGINGPWGTTIDGDDNVWVSNFGQMTPNADYTSGGLTKLAGANPATRPAGLNTGDPISPESGYTLPSGGSPVLLANGEPLYGFGKEPSYSPLMRQTNCTIDQAGNVWVCNNWKPSFANNVSAETGNPGGDGIVIFVGLAKPPKKL
ncbi:MAG TPA: hypothetical protein VFI24_22055 [Pyrinomonadaceae bacterium]|nr:hypothetical protein [Pyrinomonadaceae bacterium]